MSYWDTSAIIKLYVKESDSLVFENYLLTTGGRLVTSRIALYESKATFNRKESEGTLLPGGAKQLFEEMLRNIAAREIHVVELGADVEKEYARVLDLCFLGPVPTPVRTLDALHLASACAAGEKEIVATDSRLRAAALPLGLILFLP